MADNEIKYTTIRELDINAAMKASAGATTAQAKMDKANGTVWEQTVAPLMEAIEEESTAFTLDTTKEGIQDIGTQLKEIYERYMCNKGVVFPETGKNRKGETFVLKNAKTGKTSFSQWAETRRIWAYIGDVAKIIAFGHQALLYPEKYKVGARVSMLKMCKVETSAMENIQRLTKDLQGFLEVVDGADALNAQTAVDGLSVKNVPALEEASGLLRKLDALCSTITEQSTKDQLSTMLLNVAQKHF